MPLCHTDVTSIAWRDITIAMSGDPTLSAGSVISGLDLVEVDAKDLPTGFGAQPGRLSWPPRDIIATKVLCLTPATAETLRRAMMSGDADAAPEPLDITAPTMWEGVRRLYAVPRRCASSVARPAMMTRALSRDLLWTGHDPRLYSTEETDYALPAVVTQAGNTPSPWRAVLLGPVAGPEVRRLDTGQALRWPTVTLGADDVLTLDLRAGTAWVGDVDVSGLAVDDDDMPPVEWEVPDGEDGIEMTTNAPSATVWVRDAWL